MIFIGTSSLAGCCTASDIYSGNNVHPAIVELKGSHGPPF